MPWYDSTSFLPMRKDGLAALVSIVQIAGFTVAAAAMVVAVSQLSTANAQLNAATQQLQLARQALQASTAWQAQKEGRELLNSVQATDVADCIFVPEQWESQKCTSKEFVRKRDMQLVKLIQFYASVNRQRSVFNPEDWEAFHNEICRSLNDYRPIQIFWRDTVQSGTYSSEFKSFLKTCPKK